MVEWRKKTLLSGFFFICTSCIADAKLKWEWCSPFIRRDSVDVQYQLVWYRLLEFAEKSRDLLGRLTSNTICCEVVLLTTKALLCSYSSSKINGINSLKLILCVSNYSVTLKTSSHHLKYKVPASLTSVLTLPFSKKKKGNIALKWTAENCNRWGQHSRIR